jgi:hypothetical protein
MENVPGCGAFLRIVSLREKKRDCLPAKASVSGEVITVNGHDLAVPRLFAHANKAGIRKVHRTIGVFSHQFRQARRRRLRVEPRYQ